MKKMSNLKVRSQFTLLFVVGAVLVGAPTAQAEQNSAPSYFDHAPRLIRSATSSIAGLAPATYEFTITLPSDAGAALETVKITQEQNLERSHLNVAHSQAFLGESVARGTLVSLAAIGGEMPQDSQEAIVTFNPPIQPGQTVTVALDASRNPSQGGVYLFGVTAYPVGNQTSGLFLGFGRIQLQSH